MHETDATTAIPSMESYYLPQELQGIVESCIVQKRPALAAPILDFASVINDAFHQPAVTGIDLAMLDLVHQGSIDLPVYYCVSAAPAVNAMVARFQSFYCIVISEGLYGHIYPIAAGLLSHEPLRTFLAGGKEPHDDNGSPGRTRRDAFAWLHAHGATAAGPEALQLCRYYVEVIIYFVVAHEIGHIVGGHLGSRSLDASLITEADALTGEAADGKRALEIDADMFASLATAMFIGRRGSSQLWSELDINPTTGMRLLFGAAYILFSVMDLFGPEDALARRQKGHPAPLIRMHILGLVVANTVAQLSRFNRESIWDQGVHAVRAVEIALYEMAGGIMEDPQALAYEEAANVIWEEHIRRWPEVVTTLDRSRRSSYPWAATLP
ncbi:hypothetical protein [Sphingomonas sp. BK069]|uniref:hypothetical protein n=1 Tax=Sphingomonas sp. BK069 TaxID=2586979 RepID=UPI00160F8863|nr:hypothetical protein [Sphingomonas sp. BK069]MBB3348325.1 hypothetical protein [Sphingomonas sp. BK069]